MGLPKTTETTSVCIPSWLLEIVDEYCSRNDMSRSAFIVRCVRKYTLLKADLPDVWEHIYKDRNRESCEDL